MIDVTVDTYDPHLAPKVLAALGRVNLAMAS